MKSKPKSLFYYSTNLIYRIYVGIGTLAVAILAGCVIFAVIMRYCFNLSFAFLEEFMTTIFAFTTFWGIGICIIEDEHVSIDALFSLFPPKIQFSLKIFNLLVVAVVNGFLLHHGINYTQKYGQQLSMGMRIPMKFMYGIIPLGAGIGIICIVFKTGQLLGTVNKKTDPAKE